MQYLELDRLPTSTTSPGNDFAGALVLILKPDAFTVQLALSRLSTFDATDQGLAFADMAIAILAHLARKLGGTVAIIDRDLFGGSWPFWKRAFDPAEPFADPRRSDSTCR